MKINFPIIVLGLYLAGILASQSLVAVTGTICVLGALFHKEHWKASLVTPFYWAIVWVLLSAANLIFQTQGTLDWHAFKDLPYLLIPLAAGLFSKKLVHKRLEELPLFSTFSRIALLLLVAALLRSFYQALVQLRPATGLLRNQIYFAYSILPLFLICAEFCIHKSLAKNRRFLFASLAALLATLLVLSHTRMTWLVLLLWCSLRAVPYLLKRGNKKAVLCLGLAFVLGGSFLFLYQPDFQNKVGRIFDPNDPSRVARAFIWKFNFDQFWASPFFGIGYEKNGAIPLDASMRNSFLNAGLNPDFKVYAHNSFLQALVDNGLIGFGLWIGFWILLGLRTQILGVFLLFMGIAGLTENIFNNSRPAHAFYFCVLVLLIWEEFHKIRKHEL